LSFGHCFPSNSLAGGRVPTLPPLLVKSKTRVQGVARPPAFPE
jgi:hypothetical protein